MHGEGGVRRGGTRASIGLFLASLLVPLLGATSAQAAAPVVLLFNPITGPVGTSVIITGNGFDDASVATAVTYNGTAAAFTVDSNIQITATVPSGATTGPIAITDSEGSATSVISFTVTSPGAPVILAFNPISGPVGTSVTLTGTSLTGATTVTFNGVSAVFTVNSDAQITTTVPAGATTGPVSVTTPGGTATSAINFTVTSPGAPVVVLFNPIIGPVGTSVAITGTNFTGATEVKFNGVSAMFTVNSETKITTTVPTGATTGPVSVTKPSGTATSSIDFTVTGQVETHTRSIALKLRRHLVAVGHVSATNGFQACESDVRVIVQYRRPAGWRTAATVRTSATGRYRTKLEDRVGAYRAIAVKEVVNGGSDVCARATSPGRRHTS